MENPANGKFIHGGLSGRLVSMMEDKVFMPQWMMEYLEIGDGNDIELVPADLQRGTFVRFQPLSSAFLVKRFGILAMERLNLVLICDSAYLLIRGRLFWSFS